MCSNECALCICSIFDFFRRKHLFSKRKQTCLTNALFLLIEFISEGKYKLATQRFHHQFPNKKYILLFCRKLPLQIAESFHCVV